MRGQLFITRPHTRDLIKAKVDALPDGFEVVLREPKRTLDQNSLLWCLLSDLSRAAPEGRRWPPETWKAAMMFAAGHEIQWQPGIDESPPFPSGFRSSRLTKAQMSELIEFTLSYGDRHGVRWTEPQEVGA